MKVKNALFVACTFMLSLSNDALFAVSSSSSSSSIEAEMSELANPAGKRVCIIGACPGVLGWEQGKAVEKVVELARATEKTVFVDSSTPCTNNHVTVINQDLNALDAADNLIRQDVRDMDLAITDYYVYYFLKEDRLIDLLKLLKIGGHLLIGPVFPDQGNYVYSLNTNDLKKRLQDLKLKKIYTNFSDIFTGGIVGPLVHIGWHVGRKTEPAAVKAALEQNNEQPLKCKKIAFDGQVNDKDEQERKDMIFEYLDYAARYMTTRNLESYIFRGWRIETSVTTWDAATIGKVVVSYLPRKPSAHNESVWIDIKKLSQHTYLNNPIRISNPIDICIISAYPGQERCQVEENSKNEVQKLSETARPAVEAGAVTTERPAVEARSARIARPAVEAGAVTTERPAVEARPARIARPAVTAAFEVANAASSGVSMDHNAKGEESSASSCCKVVKKD